MIENLTAYSYLGSNTTQKTVKINKVVVLKILIFLLSLFILLECLFYFIFLPMSSGCNVLIQGDTGMKRGDFLSFAGIGEDEKWLNFDTASVATKLARNPLYESVFVEKKIPNIIEISLKQREPVAVLFALVDNRTIALEVDKNGIVFRVGNTRIDQKLPILTGLTIDNPEVGIAVNQKIKPLLENISSLQRNSPVLLSSISEIKIEQKNYGGFELVLYPVLSSVRVRVDKALNEDTLQYMMLVLDVVKDLALDIDELDIRAGTVAYRLRGNSL